MRPQNKRVGTDRYLPSSGAFVIANVALGGRPWLDILTVLHWFPDTAGGGRSNGHPKGCVDKLGDAASGAVLVVAGVRWGQLLTGEHLQEVVGDGGGGESDRERAQDEPKGRHGGEVGTGSRSARFPRRRVTTEVDQNGCITKLTKVLKSSCKKC